MRPLLLAASFLLISFSAQAQDVAVPDLQDPKYYACHADADCTLINMPCGGHDAVNNKFRDEVQTWADQIAMLAKCRQPPEKPEMKAYCRESRCTAETAK